jgi:hypothetical protein
MPATLGALAIASCLLLGVGGAAARPAGSWLGGPGPGAAGAVLVLVALLAATRRGALAPAAGLWIPLALVGAGLPLAGARALSGPPLVALALAAVVLVISSAPVRLPRWLFVPLVFLVLVLAAGRSHVTVGPEGDEPHYLMVAESLRRDLDLSLERDYAEGRYAAFHDAPLAPHYRVRGRRGEIFSLHAVGLSVLVLPAWSLAGYAGVTVFMALLAALLVREVREWVLDLSGEEALATGAAAVFALSPPLVHYAGLVFTEVPAALALSYGLRRGRDPRLGAAGVLSVGLAAAALPWLNVRYALLALVVLLHAAWRHRGRQELVALAVPFAASVAGLAAHHHALYGFLDPRRVYGRRPEMALSTLPEGLPGLLLDQEFGLLVYAPLLVLAVPGLLCLFRRDRRQALAVILAVAAVATVAGSWHMWRGGFNPPGRFLVPIVPLLAVAAALTVRERGVTAGTALLAGWGLWAGLGGALDPALVHRDRDGTAPLFRLRSGAREWTGLLPGYVLEHPDRHRLAAVWAVALLAAVPWRARRPNGVRLAVACAGLTLAAESAAALSSERTDDRDAVRLVGRRSVAAPGFVTAEADGQWTLRALGWGPLYEPHRHPGGAPLGRRLPLRAGSYRLDLEAEDLSGGATALLLGVAVDRPRAPWSEVPLRPRPGGFTAAVDVPAGARAVNLRLRGGGPIVLKGLRLLVQPSARGPV